MLSGLQFNQRNMMIFLVSGRLVPCRSDQANTCHKKYNADNSVSYYLPDMMTTGSAINELNRRK